MPFFQARYVDFFNRDNTDGSVLCEVVTEDGERVADCSTLRGAETLANCLNDALTVWVAADPNDRIVNTSN